MRNPISDRSHFSDGWCSVQSFQRLNTLQAELGLMLRISHKCGKVGAQILLSMVVLEHLALSRAVDLQIKGTFKQGGNEVGRDPIGIDKQQLLVAPILRLVSSLTSLVHLIYSRHMGDYVARKSDLTKKERKRKR
ncbi:hypothetical protein IHE45_10G095900 [Dioscorea alata]|uniref:Uncharacterized protein n=1 Tax=Dioscorea alata TaxID=55571 RepID=A0ACB7VCI2_DIOAL|nr:hypothetical protein IHE45_10G095900 [Dioscorea alata]